jgi:large repetitive protein
MRLIKVFLFTALLALIVVPVALALRFTDEAYHPPVGYTGQPYSWAFTGAAGCGPALPYQFKVLDGSLPPGLTLDTSGLVHGTPTQSGDYSFWLQLSDENPPSASWCVPKTAERMMTIQIRTGLNINQNALNPKGAFVNQPYSFQLTAQGASSPTWSIASGALPAGMTLNSATGLISGTPTATGAYTFKVQISDGGRTDAETYTLTVVEPLKLALKTTAAEAGLPFQLALQASGGSPGYTWSLEGALPAGVQFDAVTAQISGTPTAGGSFPLKVTVHDKLGLTQTTDVDLVVAAHLAISKKPLKVAKVGSRYSARLVARGGVLPHKWTLLGGRPGLLPRGIKLDRRTGRLSGTPTKAGVYRLRLQVVDKLGVKSSAGFVLKVVA